MLGIILGIGMFMFLVIIHELGHFWAAKKSGVKVKEFGIWIPPKICTLWKDKSGTEYTLNWIPLGGFVSLKGEDSSEEDCEDKDTFMAAKLWKKLMIIVAGVVMNLITAFVIFTVIFTIGVRPISIVPNEVAGIKAESFLTPSVDFLTKEGLLTENEQKKPLIIEWILSWSLAEQLGLDIGDQISMINNLPVSPYTIGNILSKHTLMSGNTLVVSGENSNGKYTKNLTFDCDKDCFLGISYEMPNLIIKMPFHKSLLASLKEIKGERNMTMNALGGIFGKLFSTEKWSSQNALKQLTGPVGAIKFGEKLFDQGGRLIFLGFGAMISLALAFFNILPIPALDGGRFWTSIIQHLSGSKAKHFAKYEWWVNMIFFWLLMLMGIVILVKDLIVWWNVSLPFIG